MEKSKESYGTICRQIIFWFVQKQNECTCPCSSIFFSQPLKASTDQGYVYVADIRQEKPLLSHKAHDSAVTGLALSFSVPNLLFTGSTDEFVKIWDIEDNCKLNYVDQKDFGIVS